MQNDSFNLISVFKIGVLNCTFASFRIYLFERVTQLKTPTNIICCVRGKSSLKQKKNNKITKTTNVRDLRHR